MTESCQFGWLQGSENLLKGKNLLVAGARYVPNKQFLSVGDDLASRQLRYVLIFWFGIGQRDEHLERP